MDDTLTITSGDLDEFLLSKGLTVAGDMSEDPSKDPVEVACRYMAAWLGYDTIIKRNGILSVDQFIGRAE